MYRGNFGPPAMGPGGYEGAMNGSSVKKKKRVKTVSSPADLLERIQKRLRSENFFDVNESDAMASPSSSNPRMKFNSNNQPNSFSGPGQASAQGDMMLPRPLPPVSHPPRHSSHMHSSHDYGYSGQHGSDYNQHQQSELHPKHSAEAQSSDGKRNVSSRLGPPSLAGNEMHSGREKVPYIPGLGDDMDMTGSEGFPSVASFNKPSITDFLEESFNSQDIEPVKTDYWKYGVSESSSASFHSKSSRACSSASPAPDSQKSRMSSSFNTEFKSGRSGTFNFLSNASRGQKNSAYGQSYGKGRSSTYSGSDSSRRSHQKVPVSDYSATSGRRGRAPSRGFQSRDSPTRRRHTSPFVTKSGRTGSLMLSSAAASRNRVGDLGTAITKSGRTGSLVLPAYSDKEKKSDTSNFEGAISYTKSSSKWDGRLSGYEKSSGNESGLSKNWKRCSEGREKESTVPISDDISMSIDHASEIDIPQEALQCHVCRLQNFSNHHAYNKHLQSPHHQHMFQLLGVRNDNLEAFKRAAAKLSSRALEYEVMDDGSVKEVQGASGSNFIRCNYCYATVLNTAVDAHNQLLQHKELVEFTRPLCCGIKFVNRRSYESHKNTTKHLAKKFAKEKEFISKVICQIHEDMMKAKMRQPNDDIATLSHDSLNIPQSHYIQRVLEKMDSDPCIQDDKSNYCLVCEVSVPEFRITFHPSCSDHHENKHTFCSFNKSRIAGLIAKVLSEMDQHNKSANTGVSDQNKLGKDSVSSQLISHTENKNSTVAQEIEAADDFEYDFECVPNVADENSKSQVETKQPGMSTSDGQKVHHPKSTEKEPASLDVTTTTSDIKAITELTDMEMASSDGSGEDGQFEYEFSGVKSDAETISAKPVVQCQVSEVKQTIEEEKMSKSEENYDEGEEEFDYEFNNSVSEMGNIVPPVVTVSKDKTVGKTSKLQSDTEVNVQSTTNTVGSSSAKTDVKRQEIVTKEDSSKSNQKMSNQTEKTVSDLLELSNVHKKKSKCIDEALDEFYVQFDNTDVLKGAAPPVQKVTASSTNSLQAQEENDIDDEIDEFDYQFDTPASEHSLSTVQVTTSASSIDIKTVTGDAAVQLKLATTKTHNQTRVDDGDECNKVTEAGEVNTEEDEFEYHIEEKVPDDGTLNNKRVEEKSIGGQNDDEKVSENSEFEYQMEEKKSSDEDEFEYQMEEENNVEKAKTVNREDKNTTGEDEFEHKVEEDIADEGEFEYQLDGKVDDEDEFEYDIEENVAEQDEIDDKKVAEEGKIEEGGPTLADEQESNKVQEELSGEEEFEYQIEAHDSEESKGDDATKLAKNVEVESRQTEDKLAEDSDFEYEMEKETENVNSLNDKDDEEDDEFEYQLEGNTVAKEDDFDGKLDKTSKEKDLDTNVEEDEFEYNSIDQSNSEKNTDIPNTGDLCEEKDPSEFGEEEEYAFDYELPDVEGDDPKHSSASKESNKEATEIVKSSTSEIPLGKETSTQIINLEEKDTEDSEDEFDYDVEEYETEIKTVRGALGKVSDQVKEEIAKEIAEDSSSSYENTSTNVSSEKIESVKSLPLKFKIPSVAPYSSDNAHAGMIDADQCQNVKSASIPPVSDKINVLKSLEDTSSADTETTAAASITFSARTPSVSPKRSVEKSARISKRTLSRSPARSSSHSPGDKATEVREEATQAMEVDVKCTLPKDSEIKESSKIKGEQNVLVDVKEDHKEDDESINPKLVESSGTKSIKIESVESASVKVNVVDSEDEKKISVKQEDDESTSRSRTTKSRVRSSRSMPLKATGVTPIDDGAEAAVTPSRRVGAKRGRASTLATASEVESQESADLLVTPSKRPARSRASKQEVKAESKETVEILLEVIDEEGSSPRKKGKSSKLNVKGRMAPSADLDDDASETLPPSSQDEEEEMKKDEEKVISPRGRRGGRARRGNSTKISPKKLNVSLDEEEDPSDFDGASGSRKREAPANSDDEGSVCSVTRGGRPSKRGRGGAATRAGATPKAPAASLKKTTAGNKPAGASVKATAAAAVTPQPARGGKGKQPTTPATESRSKRRSCAPVRYE